MQPRRPARRASLAPSFPTPARSSLAHARSSAAPRRDSDRSRDSQPPRATSSVPSRRTRRTHSSSSRSASADAAPSPSSARAVRRGTRTESTGLLEHRDGPLVERDGPFVDLACELVDGAVVRAAARHRRRLLLHPPARTLGALALAVDEPAECGRGIARAVRALVVGGHRPMLTRGLLDPGVHGGTRGGTCVSFGYPAPRPGEATSPPTVMRPVADAVLPCDSSSPAAARHAVQTALHERGADAVSDEAALLVSEVVTNALRHAGSGVAVHIDLGDDAVRVTVTDHGPG